ncbi:MAG: Na(+)-translocating NADH-quinone reductase subunit A [Xanthomonadales bacterium]|nr:Na(+)-translocating NADH-quinone reductase subunit A [Xanthomonadales bacterium]
MTRTIRIRKGFDVPVQGEPEQVVYPGAPLRHVALCGVDYVGLRPRMLVEVGDAVGLGQPLWQDKRDPGVCYPSPGRGVVTAINRGARRVLESVVVSLQDAGAPDLQFEALTTRQIEGLKREQVVERLLKSGLWTAFRTRPFSRVPLSDSAPRAIFVTAIDTRPLAPDPAVVVARDVEHFALGLSVLTHLTEGKVWLCTAPNWAITLPGIDRVHRVVFSGPHPAGLPGTHMHFLSPVGPDRTNWHINFQDVTALGRLFHRGAIDTERVVSLCGVCVNEPRLVATRVGAALEEMLRDGVCETAACRVISGSVLGGRAATGTLAYLGRYHDQVSVFREGGRSFVFGWTGLFPRRYTAAPTFARRSGHRKRWMFSTTQNGRYSGMLPMRVFDRVMPLDVLPSPLLRALLVKDTDRAQALGCLELDEEDLALCSFVCPAKNDYGVALRLNLEQIEKEG